MNDKKNSVEISHDSAPDIAQLNPEIISLMDICREIGAMAETNGSYQDGLLRAIKRTGKDVTLLTVSELLTISREYNASYNTLYANL